MERSRCFSPPRQVRTADSLARSLPPARRRRLANAWLPASAACVAPHQPRAGLRPWLPQAQHSQALRAARDRTPGASALPRRRRSRAPFRPLVFLEPSRSTLLVPSPYGGRPSVGRVPRCGCAFRFADRRWRRRELAAILPKLPPSCHPAAPPAVLALVAVANPWGSAPNPGPRRRPGSGNNFSALRLAAGAAWSMWNNSGGVPAGSVL